MSFWGLLRHLYPVLEIIKRKFRRRTWRGLVDDHLNEFIEMIKDIFHYSTKVPSWGVLVSWPSVRDLCSAKGFFSSLWDEHIYAWLIGAIGVLRMSFCVAEAFRDHCTLCTPMATQPTFSFHIHNRSFICLPFEEDCVHMLLKPVNNNLRVWRPQIFIQLALHYLKMMSGSRFDMLYRDIITVICNLEWLGSTNAKAQFVWLKMKILLVLIKIFSRCAPSILSSWCPHELM